MGRHPSYAIDVRNRHPFCPALSYEEWERLRDKIGLKATIDLGFRVTQRDFMLKYQNKKSVPKHRIGPKGQGWP